MVKSLLLNSASAYANSVINKFLNSFTVCGFRLQILRIPPTFADSTFILRNPLTFAESKTTSYFCLLRNPQQINSADKIYVTSICTRNLRKSCKWSSLTFWNLVKYLSLESRNIQTQVFAPIQCTVWPQNKENSEKNFSSLPIVAMYSKILTLESSMQSMKLVLTGVPLKNFHFFGRRQWFFLSCTCWFGRDNIGQFCQLTKRIDKNWTVMQING